MFKKILVAVDGSDSSWKALDYARALAEKFAGALIVVTVVHTYPAGMLGRMPPIEILDEHESRLGEHGQLVLQAAQSKLRDVVPAEYILDRGHPVERIVSLAKDEKRNVDTVIIGSRGLSGIEEFFLGSVSVKVAEHCPVPVLIVK